MRQGALKFDTPTYLNEPEVTHRQRLINHQDLTTFMFAGNSTLTLQSRRTDSRYTYRIKAPREQGEPGAVSHFVAVLTGPQNTTDFQYIGHIYRVTKEYKHGSKSRITPNAPSAMAFSWFYKTIVLGTRMHLEDLEIWHEGRCGKCNRKLTVPESIENGIGPECAKRLPVNPFYRGLYRL